MKKKIMRLVIDEFLNFLFLSSALKYFSVVASVFLFAFFVAEEAMLSCHLSNHKQCAH